MLRDDNYQIHFTLDSFNVVETEPSAFDGGTADARGNDGGSNDPFTLFTVTGEVLVRIFGICTTSLAGATATLEVGVTGNTAVLIAQTTATDIDANDVWFDSTPSVRADALSNLPGATIIVGGSNIIETVGTTDITSGNISYVCLWRPLSHDGNVVDAN